MWSFEWSINWNLDDLTYQLGLDTDPSLGVTFGTLLGGLSNPFDPINVSFADHGIGDNATGNGSGTVAADGTAYASLIAANNVAQQSWKPHWFIDGFDPTVDGTYDIYLAAFDSSGAEQARSAIQIIVGAGGSTPVPEPATLALASTALLGLAIRRRRRG